MGEFNRLTRIGTTKVLRTGRWRHAWSLRCDCGNTVEALPNEVRRGRIRSCGCIQPRHGWSRTPEHIAWKDLRKQAGLVDSFPDFLAAVGTKPTPRHAISRLDATKPYTLDNLFWASPLARAVGHSRTRWVQWEGGRIPLAELARRLGVSRQTVRYRVEHGIYNWAD